MKCELGAVVVALSFCVFWSEVASAGEVSAPAQSAGRVDLPVTAASAHRVFFEGDDSRSFVGLWYSLGTSATTIEVGGLNGAGIVGAKFEFQVLSIAKFGSGILFAGQDSTNPAFTNGLWISDGTGKGTDEIGGLKDRKVKGAARQGLFPTGIVPFGDHHAIFLGSSSNSSRGLWATDGTAAGTVNLNLAKGAYASGLNYYSGAALQSRFIFNGVDEYGYTGLWLTDGSIAGTTEIGGLRNSGINGVRASGFSPTNFYAAGSLCYFFGLDSTGYSGLWVSNGTPGGTMEIGGAKNAGISNYSGAYPLGLIGGSLLFAGYDKGRGDDWDNLWVTDGTVAGSVEIGGLGSAGLNNGVQFPLNPSNVAALGTEALFIGNDPKLGTPALWVTNGTTLGTTEVLGRAPNSLFSFDPKNVVAIGSGVALFQAVDASGSSTLWVTNGTTNGTSEIGGLNNKGISGSPALGISPQGIVAAGGKAYFLAMNSAAVMVFWVTDGTAAGTRQIAHVKNQNSWLSPQDVTWAP